MHEFSGKNHRFKIDDYFALSPYPEKDGEFRGNCPVTSKTDGLILTESPLEINLPHVDKQFTPKDRGGVFRGFRNYLYSINKKMIPRHPESDLEGKKAERINTKCKEIASDTLKKAYSLLNHNKSVSKDYRKCAHLEFRVDFFLNENHRLFHPGTDNILCSLSDVLGYSDLKSREVHYWLSNPGYFQKFEYCWMFYSLAKTHSVRIEDLLEVECAISSFELRFDLRKAM